MMTNGNNAPAIVRTGQRLTIAGTRITVYEVMEYLKADWPVALIRDWMMLTGAQLYCGCFETRSFLACKNSWSQTERSINAALIYIQANREEVEEEYQLVLEEAEEVRTYWEARNRDLFQYISQLPAPPGREELYQKVKASKAALRMA